MVSSQCPGFPYEKGMTGRTGEGYFCVEQFSRGGFCQRQRQEMRESQEDTGSSGSQVSPDYKERSPSSFVNNTRLLSQ